MIQLGHYNSEQPWLSAITVTVSHNHLSTDCWLGSILMRFAASHSKLCDIIDRLAFSLPRCCRQKDHMTEDHLQQECSSLGLAAARYMARTTGAGSSLTRMSQDNSSLHQVLLSGFYMYANRGSLQHLARYSCGGVLASSGRADTRLKFL